jgi:hypothetical protein
MLHRSIGGKIWAENNPDKGVFCFKIPLIKPMKLKKKVPLLQARNFLNQKLKKYLLKMTVSR